LTCGISLFRENLVGGEGSGGEANLEKVTYVLSMQTVSFLLFSLLECIQHKMGIQPIYTTN
jgi:hypothetical protein